MTDLLQQLDGAPLTLVLARSVTVDRSYFWTSHITDEELGTLEHQWELLRSHFMGSPSTASAQLCNELGVVSKEAPGDEPAWAASWQGTYGHLQVA